MAFQRERGTPTDQIAPAVHRLDPVEASVASENSELFENKPHEVDLMVGPQIKQS